MSTETAVKRPRTISGKVATNHVHKNLIKFRKTDDASEFAGFPMGSVETFAKHVKSYLVEVSKLATGTLDRADYEELLEMAREATGWKSPRAPKKEKATIRLDGVATKAAVSALATMEITASVKRATPPPVVQAVALTPSLRRKATQEPEDKPSRKNKAVPGNWRYMADNADTPSARAWWANYCERRMRGEV